MSTRPALKPGRWVDIAIREKPVHDFREILFSQLVVLDLIPRLAQCLLGRFKELRPEPIALELELEVGYQGFGGAVAQALLHLAKGDSMHVFIVAGDAADVEHDSHRVDLLAQSSPGVFELSGEWSGVATQPGFR